MGVYAEFLEVVARANGISMGDGPFLLTMTQVFLKALEGVKLHDDFQGIIKSLAVAYPRFTGPYFVPGLEPTLWRLAVSKGIEPSGIVSAITLNGLPVGIERTYLMNQGLLKSDVTITLPETMQQEAISWPVIVVLMGDTTNDTLSALGACVDKKLSLYSCYSTYYPNQPFENPLLKLSTQQLVFTKPGSESFQMLGKSVNGGCRQAQLPALIIDSKGEMIANFDVYSGGKDCSLE